SPGVRLAKVAELPQPQSIFNGTDLNSVATIRHLLPSRFPAAWNAANPGLFGDPRHPQPENCLGTPVPVLVSDAFASPPPGDFTSLFPPLEGPNPPEPGYSADALQHGYLVAEVLGANSIGANPFPFSGCLDLRLVQVAGLSATQRTDEIFDELPGGQ